MDITQVDVNELKFAPYNPRKISPEVMEKLKKSIQEFGVYSPLIVNKKTSYVVGGNQRLMALRELGHKTVHVVWVDLSSEKEKVLNIQLNKIIGDWNFDVLAQLLDELSKMPEIDVTDTGFDLPEISQIFDNYGTNREEDDFDFDAAVNLIDKPVTKAGDIISIGAHKLMCADATVPENVKRLFEHEQAMLYWSDWPYCVNYDAGNRPGAKPSKWAPIKNDNLSDEEYIAWMRQVLLVTLPYLKSGAPTYLWNGHLQFWHMTRLCIELGIHPACVITWAKPGFAPSFADYQQQTEFCLYGWKEGAAHSWFGEAESSLWSVSRDPAKSLVHPSQKPIELAQRALRNSTVRGDLMFDSCLGSGSALIAAESIGRSCFGFEIEPAYCDAIVRRYVNYIGREKASPEIVERYFAKEVVNECK